MLTAYDAMTASRLRRGRHRSGHAGGDSAGTCHLSYDTTVPVTLDGDDDALRPPGAVRAPASASDRRRPCPSVPTQGGPGARALRSATPLVKEARWGGQAGGR
ncbi:hypothetical protein LV779_19520 [Streptomyces thinghirensis]|nr:hypothetical protein [Streptomyces thinghirensis]